MEGIKDNINFNPREIAAKLSKFFNDEIYYDEKENKFTCYLQFVAVSSSGIYYYVESNEPNDYTFNLSQEDLQYILKVIQLLKENENKSISEDDMKNLCNKEIVKDFIGKYDRIDIESRNGVTLCDNRGNCHTDEIDFNSAKEYEVISKRIASDHVILVINFIADK